MRKYTNVSCKVLKETEKAYYISIEYWTDCKKKNKETEMWCPKSCCITEQGEVKAVADFVLNRWIEERNQYMKKYTSKVYQISFDMLEKERTINYIKERERKERERIEGIIEKVYNGVRPYVIYHIQCVGRLSLMYCSYMGKKSVSLSKFGKMVVEDYGVCDNDNINGLTQEQVNAIIDYYYKNPSIFTMFFKQTSSEYCSQKYGFNYDEFNLARQFGLDNKFKKEIDILNKFNKIINKLL